MRIRQQLKWQYRMLILSVINLSSYCTLIAQTSAAYFVANSGNDANPGSIARPFKTIDAAFSAFKMSSFTAVTIFLRGGVYTVGPTGFIISEVKKDSIRSLNFSSYNNEVVTITGGIQLDNTKFQKVSDPPILNRLTERARSHVFVTRMDLQGVSNFGVMNNYGTKSPINVASALELFCNHSPLTLARWPNVISSTRDSLLPIGRVVQYLKTPTADPAFLYSYDRPGRWAASVSQGKWASKWIAGYFAFGYTDDNVPVDSINSNTLYLNVFPTYGLYSSSDMSSGQIGQARHMRGYYFYNVLEELDTAGEWYLDSANKMLYVWPPTDLNSAFMEVSVVEQPLINLITCANLAFNNINFSTSRSKAIKADRSNNILFDHCTFLNFGLQAIETNACTNFHVINCTIAHTGEGGIILSGGNRKTLAMSGNSIKNCEFYDYSRLYKSSMPAVSLLGVGDTVMNCYIHDVMDQAIIFSGNNHYIAYNHIKNTCQWFSDMGAIYTGRDPSSTGEIIFNNFFENIGNPQGVNSAVYMDDGSGGMTVNQNLFYNSGSNGHGAIHVNGGSDNKFENNIFIECALAFSNQPWNDEQWKKFYITNPTYSNRLTKTVDIRSEIYLKQYPYLKDFFDTTSMRARNNYIDNTIFYNVKKPFVGSSYIVTNSFLTNTNPGFADVSKRDFRLISVPDEVRRWSEWKPVEFDKIGKR